jgi:rfaE bifunctional protein kinase chain/domain/rfaE bifunctional protein nucleotidyltransferase chain/domain
MKNFKEILGFDEKINKKILDNDFSLLQESRLNKTLVMCHGTFDLVHPGHIRHLAYAKSQGDLLLVSITSDAHVLKANARPYVPEDLRALNLAILELIDFVVIDDSNKPLELIQKVKPDIFVKGFEYNKDGNLNSKSIEEKEIIDNYGGTFLFSPGDYVLSSSQIIESDPPKIAIEKLLILMEIENVSFEKLIEVINLFKTKNICVVGDTIVDGLVEATVIGGHRKTPTPSVKVVSEKWFIGGAAIVAKHMAATGAQVTFSSIVGDDVEGRFVQSDLKESSLNLHIEIDKDRPTTFKNAVMADGYKMIRIDKVENKTISDLQVDKLINSYKDHDFDAVVLSDFRHGIFNKNSIKKYIENVPSHCLKIADSQVASRWGNILDFKGVDLITPNEQEVRFALGDQDTVIRPLGTELYELSKCKVLFLKLGSRGIMTFRSPLVEPDKRSFFSLDAILVDQLIDPVGAGDAFLAYSTLAYTVSKSEVVATIIGTIAAGIACEQEGNIEINVEKVKERINKIRQSLS